MPKSEFHFIEHVGLLPSERVQYQVFVGLSLGILALTAIAYSSDRLLFQRFLGRINPLIAIVAIALLGAALLGILLSRGWFAVYKVQTPNRFLLPAGLAAVMALIIILIDIKMIFPRDLNVPFPQSLLFYPVMGYVVEIVFHLLPLSLLLILLPALSKGISFSTIVWPTILVVSVLEPILQTRLGWPAYVGLHVFVFNVIQLVLFKRCDFIAMYSFRLAYYLLWHILWGHIRLGLLF